MSLPLAPLPDPSGHARSMVERLLPLGVPAILGLGVTLLSGPVASFVAGPAAVDTVARQELVGAAACGECHEETFAAWSGSTHGRAGGSPGPETVIAPFDGRPIRFRDAAVTPEVTASGEWVFRVEGDGRDPAVFRVDAVVGRGHLFGGGTQGFLSAFPDGTLRFLPFDFSRQAGVWFCNTTPVSGQWTSTAALAGLRSGEGWVPITPEMRLTDCGDWPPVRVLGVDERLPGCQECHGSGIDLSFDTIAGRYRTEVRSLSVDCESCHGPGGEHMALARSGPLDEVLDLRIGVLDTLPEDASLAVCFQCHALKRYLAVSPEPRDDSESRYSLLLPMVGSRPFHPDGRVRTFAYQQGHRASACYLDGSMTCVDCHAPHGLDYRTFTRQSLEGRYDDGQCLQCHASKGGEVERHTRHPADSPGSRCVACHMPYLQQPLLGDRIPYARSDHTIPVPRPAEDAALGIVDACSGCHRDRSVADLEAQARVWWGEAKPRHAAVAPLLEAWMGEGRGEEVLAAGPRHPMARVMAVDYLLQEVLVPDMETPPPGVVNDLRAVAADPDPDVRAVALAALHLVAGGDPAVARFLDGARRREDADRVVPRWVDALGLTAETYRMRGDPGRAVRTLEKVLEIDPAHVPTLLALGETFAAVPDDSAAVGFYRRVLEIEPAEAVAWVNLGLSLERLGDVGAAEAAYYRSLELDPRLGVALMNLGNLAFLRGDHRGALEQYRRAVAAEPWLARAWFYMAVAHVREGDRTSALRALRRALEFAPGDQEILRLMRDLGGEAPP